jgi:hypothetical protein
MLHVKMYSWKTAFDRIIRHLSTSQRVERRHRSDAHAVL